MARTALLASSIATLLLVLSLPGIAAARPSTPDPARSLQWHLTAVGAPRAWRTTKGDAGTVIAILDTGVDYTSPDVAGKVLLGPDFGDGDDDPMDVDGHGTAVAALAAAAQNGYGGVGVCPRCSVLAVKIFPDGSTTASSTAVAKAILWATNHGADVINLSFTADGSTIEEAEAIRYALERGAVVVAAAGNSGTSTPTYPGSYEGVVSVSALGRDGTVARFSNAGDWVDVSAPGNDLITTGRADKPTLVAWGTSFAAPIVSGAAGLLASTGVRGEEIRRLLEEPTGSTVLDIPGLVRSLRR